MILIVGATGFLGTEICQLAYAKGDSIPMEETLKTYPVRLRSVREYVRQVLSA
ncbi:MAG TPA: hypothetical protein VMW38_03860 [Terriglobia bacterium]|nr:hypothetical protein [Terriglobia bacterium]